MSGSALEFLKVRTTILFYIADRQTPIPRHDLIMVALILHAWIAQENLPGSQLPVPVVRANPKRTVLHKIYGVFPRRFTGWICMFLVFWMIEATNCKRLRFKKGGVPVHLRQSVSTS